MRSFLLATSCVFFSAPVAAQVSQVDAPPADATGMDAPATQSPQPVPTRVERDDTTTEIVVTATRSNTLLSRTPLAITAVTGESLTKIGVTNPTQIADVAPSVSIDRNNGLQITIRGISSADNSEKGDPSAGFMLDGVSLARAQAQEVSFFDLDRIEVLRGPQGTLYGRNTTAGLISLVSARPRLGEFSGSADISYGNYDAVQGTGVLNVPLGQSVALRGAVNYDRRDSYLIPANTTYEIDPFKDNLSGRLSLLVEPDDRLTIVVRGDYSSIKGRPGPQVLMSALYQAPFFPPVDGQLGQDPIPRTGNSKTRSTVGYEERQQSNRDNRSWGIQGDVAYELSDTLTASYIGSYRKFTRDEEFTGVTGRVRATGLYSTTLQTFDGEYGQNSQELRLAYDSSALKLQAGGFYFRETSDISFLLFGSQGFLPGQRGYIFGFPQETVSKSLAFFGQGTLTLAEGFRATGGARWTKDEKSRVGATIFHVNLTDPRDFTTGTQPGTTNPRGAVDSLNDAAVSYRKVTWRGGLEYDLGPRTLLYGSVSTGYKAGGFNDGCLAGAPNCAGTAVTAPGILFYEPETLTAYEVGFKTRFLDNALRLNGGYFHYDYTNLQLTQLTLVAGAGTQRTLNAGQAKIDGVELEGIITHARNHQFDFSATWLNARYTDYLVDGVGPLFAQFAGRKLDRSPEWTVSAAYDWHVPLANDGSLSFNLRTRLSDSYFITSSLLRAQFRQPSFTKSDVTITYTTPSERMYVQGFVKNIENQVTLGSALLGANFGAAFDDGVAQLTDPRLYGARIGVRF